MMKRLLQLVILAAVLYAGYEYLKPWIPEWGGDAQLQGSDEEKCVARLDLTRDEIVDKAQKWMGPPVQVSRWAGAHRLLIGRMNEARRQCQCDGAGCEEGIEAFQILDRTLEEIDREMRAGREVDVRSELRDFEEQLAESRRALSAY